MTNRQIHWLLFGVTVAIYTALTFTLPMVASPVEGWGYYTGLAAITIVAWFRRKTVYRP